ncbi:MAG: hypothetical protein ACI8QS_001333 [Planctomycetota bacterium]|jgi:hypothetical protein
MSIRSSFCVLALAPLVLAFDNGGAAVAQSDWTSGKLELQSAGALALGPDGVLFVADHMGAAIIALKLEDSGGKKAAEASLSALDVAGIDEIAAFLMGSSRESITINDLAVNQASGTAYLSVTRTAGATIEQALIAVNGPEEFEILDLESAQYQRLTLDNAPDPTTGRRNQRAESITDMAFFDGRLYVAGLSNEEFASKLRVVNYPFAELEAGTSIEIYHGAHGAWETRAPVRAMVPFVFDNEPTLLCGYTCTPLVRVPVTAIQGVEKYVGTTVAELGAGNSVLDMITYDKDGTSYLLIANTRRGMMKLETDGLHEIKGLTEPVRDTAGQPYETLEGFEGVIQLDKFSATHALILVQTDDGVNLKTVLLP